MQAEIGWRTTTMFYGTVGAVFLHWASADAADLLTKAPLATQGNTLGAVDGVNAKIDGFGGSFASHEFWGSKGAIATPLGSNLSPYGFQLDGAVGRFDHDTFGAVGGHLFWRDPSRGLLGLYGSYTNWDRFGGIHVGQVAAEGALYWDRWSIEGIAGVEWGNSGSVTVGDPVNGFTTTGFDIQTRFFDKINFGYYLQDNFKVFAGHRYLGGKNAAAFGAEYAFPLQSNGLMASLFVEARAGEDDYHGIWGGLKLYIGQHNKTLIQRHRQDDPFEWSPESLIAIINSPTFNFIPGTPPPPPCDGC
jgi:hypothetical protein